MSQAAVVQLRKSRAPVTRGLKGRFWSDLNRKDLLDAVEAVALAAADGDEGLALLVTKREWDEARSFIRMQLPTADVIRRRLDLSWVDTLAVAVLPANARSRFPTLRPGTNSAGFGDDGEELALATLQAVAHRLHGAVVTVAAYDATVEAMEAESCKWRSGPPLRLPRSIYLTLHFRSWPQALAVAGLPQAPTGAAGRAGATLAPPFAESMSRCIDFIEASDQIDEFVLPSKEYLEDWCANQSIKVPYPMPLWSDLIADTAKYRADNGKPMPTRRRTAAKLPRLIGKRGGRVMHTREAVLESLRTYGEFLLPAGQAPRQKHYLAVYRNGPEGRPKLIAPSVFERHGLFQDLCVEAGIS